MQNKKLALFFGVALILGLLAVGCGLFETPEARMQTITISYESVGMVAFPTVLAYLQQREINGSLSGDALASAKVAYANARQKYIEAGNLIISYIAGTAPTGGNPMAQVAVILRQVAVLLADLSGGKVSGNSMTIPQGGK